MRSSCTLMRKISVPIPEEKKSELIEDLAYRKELRAKRGVVKQVRFVPNTVGGSRESITTENKIVI